MGKVLVIGAGGVGTVALNKIAQHPDVFSDVMVASRTLSKCQGLADDVKRRTGTSIKTAAVDADDVRQLVRLFEEYNPDLVVNLALPYQDLTIMDACLECGVNYLDTANYEPRDEAHFEYSWQWAYKDRFEKAGLTAILGCGFDPGVSGVLRHTRRNIVSTRFNISISWIAMPVITEWHSQPISILKSISGR